MNDFDNQVLQHFIEQEKKGQDYRYNSFDHAILDKMLSEINEKLGTDFHYLAEIDAYNIKGSGIIMKSFFDLFSSHSIRAYLIPQIVSDNVKDCDVFLFQSYLEFKKSTEYIALPGKPAPTNIYVRYDNAFHKLKSKRIKDDLISLAFYPRDAFYLPLTMRMLASWKVPELEPILCSFLSGITITSDSIGLPSNDEKYYPPLSFIKRELKFLAIRALKYYPSDEILERLQKCTIDSDSDISQCAKKTLVAIEKALSKHWTGTEKY